MSSLGLMYAIFMYVIHTSIKYLYLYTRLIDCKAGLHHRRGELDWHYKELPLTRFPHCMSGLGEHSPGFSGTYVDVEYSTILH